MTRVPFEAQHPETPSIIDPVITIRRRMRSGLRFGGLGERGGESSQHHRPLPASMAGRGPA